MQVNIQYLINTPTVRDNLFLGLFLWAFAYNSFRNSETNTLLATILFGGIAYVGYMYLAGTSDTLNSSKANVQAALDKEASWLQGQLSSSNADKMWLPAFPKNKKGFTFLASNPVLVEIATNMRLLRMFDRSRYADLCHLLNTYQKTYTYILGGRYNPESYLHTFQDMGDEILELIYGTVFVIPSQNQLKHVYGVDPEILAQNNADRFTVLRRKMTKVLESYAKKEKGLHVVPESLPIGSN